MSKRSVFCIAESRGRADRIVHDLKEANFSSTDLSVLFLDGTASDGPASAAKPLTAKNVLTARSAGEIRGVLGWIAGIRSLVIPGVGPLIGAGPVAAALSSVTLGGIAGGLLDFDVPQVEASRYEGRIKDGCILISVHSENPEKSDQARGIFTENEAENICTLIEVSTPKIRLRNAAGSPREFVA
jgi:hypothetical protein